MKLITDTGEFNILNVRVIDTEMKTIYIEEKPKGFMILISNKIIDNKSGVNPGQGASETVRMDPSINF